MNLEQLRVPASAPSFDRWWASASTSQATTSTETKKFSTNELLTCDDLFFILKIL